MLLGSLPAVSNRAGWTFQVEVDDEDTGEALDLSAARIVFEVRAPNGAIVLSATSDNGKIAVIDTGIFQVKFTAAEMNALCADTYDVGCTIQNGTDEPAQFIIGRLPVLDGVVTQ